MILFSLREFIILLVVFVSYIAFFMLAERHLSPVFFIIFTGAASSLSFWAMLFLYKRMMQKVVSAPMPLWQLRGWRTASLNASFGFVMSEIALSFYFLPFSFLTKAALLLVVFFVAWRLLRLHLEGRKEKKHFLRELVYGFGSVLFLLMTTPWLPLH